MIFKKKFGFFYLYGYMKWKVITFFDFMMARICPIESCILSKTLGQIRAGERRMLCVFVHFDRDNIIDDYVLYYLESLNAAGMEIIFCTTAERVPESEIEKLRPLCRSVIVRRNVGYDFASYRTGLQEAGDLSRYDSVILANDSVYGPLCDLKDIFAAMADTDADFWGITDSLQFGHHLQSYFLVFSKTVATSNVFSEFWKTFPNFSRKISVIAHGELRFSKLLTGNGFRMGALCESHRIRSENRKIFDEHQSCYLLVPKANDNHPHFHWRLLIERYEFPFIKILLLRDNPESIPDVSDWEIVVRKYSDYDPELIRNHLRRVRRR